MTKKILETVPIGLIVLTFLVSLYFYPMMPERMASHWNAEGKVDDYMEKTVALLIAPALSLAMYVFFRIILWIDPLRENILKFTVQYLVFQIAFMGFMLYLNLIIVAQNLGYKMSMNYLMIPGLSILFFYSGVLMEKSRRNWFIGIRTPWTLSSDTVWEKTHDLGGKLFKCYAAFILIALLFDSNIPCTSYWRQ